MKAVKRLSVLLAVLLVLSLAIGFAVSAEGDAIVVTNETEFLAAMDAANANANIVLANDITLTAGNATMNATYAGTFDGAGYTINGITNTLFKKVGSTAVVKNVTLNGAIDYTTAPGVVEQRKAATIAADADSGAAFKDIVSNVDIATAANDLNAGGIVGYGKANTFENVTYAGNYTVNWNGASGSAGVGGIIGYTNNNGTSNYINCAFTGTITVTSEAARNTLDLGGIIGIARNGVNNFENCVCTGDLVVTAEVAAKNVGYVVGWNRDASATIAIKNCFSYADADVAGFIGSGDATQEGNVAAIAVATADEFRAAMVEANNAAYIVLTADIDLGEAGNTTMGGTFTGTFDGQGHTISGVTATIFPKIVNGTVKNVTVNGAITGGNRDIGTLSIRAEYSVIENVTSNVNITLTGEQGDLNAGGIIGYGKGTDFIKCTYAGTYTVENGGGGGFGGIVGYVNNSNVASKYTDCAFTGNIVVNGTKTGTLNLGAIIGRAKDGALTIARPIATGTITLNNAACGYKLGGIAGSLEDAGTVVSGAYVGVTVVKGEGVNVGQAFFAGNATNGVACTGAIKMDDGSYLANDGEGLAAVLKYMPADAIVKVNADVTLPAGTPTYTTDFSGTLDGQGYTVSGITNTLFKKIKNGTVKNITLEGSIDYTTQSDNNIARKAAAVAWDAAGVTLEDVICKVDVATAASDLNAGGIIGYANEAQFTNCVYAGTYTANWTGADGAVGGIAGYIRTNSGTNVYTNCAFTGTLNVTGASAGKNLFVGGLVGKHRQADVQVVNFTNTGAINVATTDGSVYVGGFIGTDNDVANLTMSGLFEGTINAPGATVDNFLALDDKTAADLSGCKASAKFDKGTIALDKDGAYLIGTESYSAFLSTRDGAVAGTKDYRFIIVADGATYKTATEAKLTLSFTKDGAVVKTLTSTIADLVLYAKATAAGNVYAAAEGCFITGIVVTGVPTEAWDTVTVAVVDGDATLAEGEVANADIAGETLYTVPETAIDLNTTGGVNSIAIESHHADNNNNPTFVICLYGDDAVTAIYQDIYSGGYNPNYVWYVSVNGGAEFVPASFSQYDGGTWGYLRAELGADFFDLNKYDITLAIVDKATAEAVYYGNFFILNGFLFDETKPENISAIAPEDITVIGGPNIGGGEGADKAFDGKHGTKVCTGDVGPDNALIVELKNTFSIVGVGICNANDNEGNNGRTVLDFEIYVSADGTNWGEAVYVATAGDKNKADYSTNFMEMYHAFDAAVEAKFVKVVVNNDGLYQISDVLLYVVEGEQIEVGDVGFENHHADNNNEVVWVITTAYASLIKDGTYTVVVDVDGTRYAIDNLSYYVFDDGSGYVRMNLEGAGLKPIIKGTTYNCTAYLYNAEGKCVYFSQTAAVTSDVFSKDVVAANVALPTTGIKEVEVNKETLSFEGISVWNAEKESIAQLFDGNTSTTKMGGNVGDERTVTLYFSLNEAATLAYYTLYTGNDTDTGSTRNPKDFILYGKVGEDWVALSSAGFEAPTGLIAKRATPFNYAVTNPQACTEYKLVMTTEGQFQLNELKLYVADETVTAPTAAAAIGAAKAEVILIHRNDWLKNEEGTKQFGLATKGDGNFIGGEAGLKTALDNPAYVLIKDVTAGGDYVRYEITNWETARHCDIRFDADGFTPEEGHTYDIILFIVLGEGNRYPAGTTYAIPAWGFQLGAAAKGY